MRKISEIEQDIERKEKELEKLKYEKKTAQDKKLKQILIEIEKEILVLKSLGLKPKSIIVSFELFHSMCSIFEKLPYSISPLYCSMPRTIKYKGWDVFENYNLKVNEYHIGV